MNLDLVVEGRVFIRRELKHCSIGIDKDIRKIVALKKVLTGKRHKDFGERIILPGGIDPHVHFRDPGYVEKEDFFSGTLSSTYGGITTIFDMPNTNPPVLDIWALKEKHRIAKQKACVNYGLYAALTGKNLGEAAKLSKDAIAFKLYLASAPKELLFPIKKLPLLPNKLSNLRKVLVFHAEDPFYLRSMEEKDLADHLKAHPTQAEVSAINNLLAISKPSNLSIYVAHLSTKEGIELVKRSPISCGVTPHHLLLPSSKEYTRQSYYKVNPPLRSKEDCFALFKELAKGRIDCMESDHAPHSLAEKSSLFKDAPSGIPGVETLLPLMLYQVKQGNLSLGRLVYAFANRPAEIFSLRTKGSIEVEKDADLVVFSFKDEERIKAKDLHSKCGYTPYEGMQGIFPSWVFLGGETILAKFEFVGEAGMGVRADRGGIDERS
jgi:dihydroorotase